MANDDRYHFITDTDYTHTGYPFSLVDTQQPFSLGRKLYFLFQQTPESNNILFLLARLALRMQRKNKS